MTSGKFNARATRAPSVFGLHRPSRGLSPGGALIGLVLAAFSFSLLAAAVARAQGPAPIISKIEIAGNQRVDQDAILIHITQQPNQPLDQTAVDADIKSIYRMGFFESVTARVEQQGGRSRLIYRVRERPQITDVKFYGMKAVRSNDDKIVAAVKVHPGSILDPVAVKETIAGVTQVYADEGYTDAKVVFKPIPQPDNTAFGEFDVTEGPKVRITKIVFEGNTAFSASVLKGQMETATYSKLLSWLTGWGALNQKKMQEDVDRLTAFYYDNGYLNVQVAQPQVVRNGTEITILIKIDEGTPYRVGRINIEGNLKFPRRELRRLLTMKSGQLFRGSALQRQVLALSDFYSNRGYAYVNIDPRTQLVHTSKRVNVVFVINPGHEVIIDRVNISGNTKTSDKVIRREIQVQEQEPYSAEEIRDSKVRLDRLGFFTDTRITTSPAAQPDKINLDVNVTEGNTASFQVAGGFDSYQSLFGNFTLGNTNLFGGGESLILNAQVGFLFQNYSVSYTEPWFLDMPLAVGLRLFDNKTYLLSFNQSSAGFTLTTTYPLTELGFKKLGPFSLKDVQAGVGYTFQSIGITGLNQYTTYAISRYKGYTQTSEITPTIRRFTVDNPVDPRTGTVESLSMEFGGVGGGEEFIKGVAHFRYFYPFLKSQSLGTFVVSQGITYGIGTNLQSGTGGELPLYERFFPGGVGGPGDVRGYELYSLGPRTTLYSGNGTPISVQDYGGSEELLLSNEITFPILSGLGIRGVIFSDAGQSFLLHPPPHYEPGSFSFTNLQASYGIGVRWKSPFGPLAVDIARPINPRASDQSTVFEIGAGSPL
ncbi:MAG: outer membrane protein assembly factor BamA [Candidatus Binatus sp.]|uniref:outer membrane protein assembly factor BamA n=1 Tax=Candidatus Binatus sp. TaxID=2811406 RepID=UPI003C846C28